jgi:hypothetical protein
MIEAAFEIFRTVNLHRARRASPDTENETELLTSSPLTADPSRR